MPCGMTTRKGSHLVQFEEDARTARAVAVTFTLDARIIVLGVHEADLSFWRRVVVITGDDIATDSHIFIGCNINIFIYRKFKTLIIWV